jgi:hypothetical protein
MILMQAPAGAMTFAGMPSGATYVSDQYGLIKIVNDSTADQNALANAGCVTLSPAGFWGAGTFNLLADLYAADVMTGIFQPGLVGFPAHMTAAVQADPTAANNGLWYKTGTGNGSGNWTFTTATLTPSASAIVAAAAATTAGTSAAIAQAALLGLPYYPYPLNAGTAAGGTNILPQGITSGTVGGTAVTGATVGTGSYPITVSGGDFTGVVANLIVTSSTSASIQIVSPGRTTVASPTAPTFAKPAGATLPAGTTLTANIGTQIANGTGQVYLTSDATGSNLLYWQNTGTGAPVAVLDGAGNQVKVVLPLGIPAAADPQVQAYNLRKLLGSPGIFGTFSDKSIWMKITPTIFLHPVIDALGATVTTLNNALGKLATMTRSAIGGPEFSLTYATDKTRWFRVTPTQIQHPVIDGYANRLTNLESGTAPTITADPTWNSIRAIGEIVHFEGYGQSLARGHSSAGAGGVGTVISSAPSNYGLMFSGGVRPDDNSTVSATIYAGLQSLAESWVTTPADSSTSGGNDGETPMAGAVQMLAQMLIARDGIDPSTSGQKFLVSDSARGGASAALLTKANGTRYPRLLANIQAGKACADASGKSYASAALFYTQGESDIGSATDPTTWTNTVLGILASVQTDWQATTGTNRPVPMIIYQTASAPSYNANDPAIPLAQTAMAIANNYVGFATPTHFLPYNANDIHLTGVGSKWLGAYYGLFAYWWLFKGIKPAPMIPTIYAEGNQIIARFPVDAGRKLVIDSNLLELMPNFGMQARNAAGTAKTLTNPRLVGRDCVVWTAGETPADVWQFCYGFSAQTASGRTNIAGGNIRDDNPLIFDPSGINRPMYKWAPIFKVALST